MEKEECVRVAILIDSDKSKSCGLECELAEVQHLVWAVRQKVIRA